eukprot:15076424-Alexandrium_andersonii.AAC.1
MSMIRKMTTFDLTDMPSRNPLEADAGGGMLPPPPKRHCAGRAAAGSGAGAGSAGVPHPPGPQS